MVALSDFNVVEKPKLSDFTTIVKGGTAINSATTGNIAAHAAVLSEPEKVLQNYSLINSELKNTNQSNTLDALIKENTNTDKAATYTELQKILRDPSIPKEQKTAYMDGYINMVTDQGNARSLSTLVTQQAILQPQSEEENDETAETATFNVVESLDEVDEYKGWLQNRLNMENTLKDRDGFNLVVDFVETMVPFLEPAATAKTRLAQGGGIGEVMQSMALLGESKADIKQAIAMMPLDQRRAAAEQLIGIVKGTGGSWTLRPNELNVVNQLNQYLVNEAYTPDDQLLDNIFSLVDVVFPLAGWTAKLGKSAKSAAATAKRAALVQESLAKEVDTVVSTNIVPEELPREGSNMIVDGVRDIVTDKVMATVKGSKDFRELTEESINSLRMKVGEAVTLQSVTDANLGKNVAKIASDFIAQQAISSVSKAKMAKLVKDVQESSNAARLSVRTPVDHTSLSQTMKDANAGKARGINDMMEADQTGDVARALYGTEKSDAIANDRLPEVANTDGSVRAKPNMNEAGPAPDANTVKAILAERGRIDLAQKEKQLMRDVVKDFFRDVRGLVPRTSMATVGESTRLYRGEGDVTGKPFTTDSSTTGRYYSADLADAEKFAKDNNGKVVYIDVPKSRQNELVSDAHKPDKWYIVSDKLASEKKLYVDSRLRNVSGTATDTPSGVSFDMVYGPKDGGFKSAQQGLEQVLLAFRKYGVTNNEIEILAKDTTGKYAPVKGIPTTDGNYLIRVKHNFEFSPGDVVEYSLLGNSKYVMFESRTSITDGNAGSVLQHAIPHSAIINSVIFNAASAASDATAKISKRLIQLGEIYAKNYKGLSPRQKALVDLYRIEANEKGIAFSIANLKARGFDAKAIETMRSWKTTTDTMWYLENVDMNKTLRARGWQRFIDQKNNSDLVVRPVSNRFGDGVKVYDPEANAIRTINRAELEDLYAKNGTVAELKQPLELDDDAVDYVISRNTEGGYIRRIRDEDISLPYRDGYYPVRYDAPIFITKEFKRKDGTTYTKAVATAANHGDAKRLKERLEKADVEGKYEARPDYKRGTQAFDDAEWSSAVSGGRSAQRIRGKRLQEWQTQTDLNHSNIDSPEEALIASIRSLASRTAFRDWLETTKSRWMSQNSDLLEPQKGQVMWPESKRKIGAGKSLVSSSRIKDAIATWQFVHAMEAGYVNLLDDMFKNFFQDMSKDFGNQNWGWLDKVRPTAEKLADVVSTGAPTRFARKKAFRLLLAANPLRQLPVQAMQALPVLMATNPLAIPKISMQMILLDYVANGGDAVSFMKVLAKKATGMNLADAQKLQKDWEASGFEAAVDAHTLIRDQMSSLVDRTAFQKARTIGAKPLDFTQKIGFNKGESILMRSVWLSEYDLLRKAGKPIDAEVLENLNARVRNLTLNMNKAGEMPYNENALAAALQFFQAPHKAFSQILIGHNGLRTTPVEFLGKKFDVPTERIKLGTAYVLTYGVGGNYLSDFIMDSLPLDPEMRELVEGGLFNLTMNAALSTIFGEEVRTDFSDSLRILQAPDIFKFWNGLIGSEVGEVLSNSASAGLVLGQNARVTNFVKQMMRPFIVDNDKKPEEIMLAGKSFLQMFSGMSNIFKAKYAMEMNKSITARGATIDYHVNDVEAFLKAAGFSTIDEVQHYASQDALYRTSGKFKDDIKILVDETSARLAAKGISNEDANWTMEMMAEAQRVYKNDPFYMEEFSNQIYYKAMAGENSMYTRLLGMSGYTTEEEFEKLVNISNLEPEFKKTLLQSKKMFGEMNNGN